MVLIPGYITLEKLTEGVHTAVYRGYREQNQQPVIIKLLIEEQPSIKDIARLEHEYEMLNHLHGDGTVTVYSLEKYQSGLALILEDFGTQSLKELLSQKKLDIPEFLSLALHIIKALEKIHQHNIMHKNLNPANILWDVKHKEIKIIGFDYATTLTRELEEIHDHEFMNKDMLFYISPEQTGRMNRGIDYRTDYYSLGIILYQMATGFLPFPSKDISEVIHAHVAMLPPPPHAINPKIPRMVSEIIMKLLSKTAEERYQSTFGLKHDINKCIKEFNRTGKIADFPLAEQDISSRFQLSEKLYGRDEELKKLNTIFDRISNHHAEIITIAGYSGVGKSTLVHELYKPSVEKRGYFISGKFDQLKKNISYTPLIQAFEEMVLQIIKESPDNVKTWRKRIQNAVGRNGQVIVEIIPVLTKLLGEQPPIPKLDVMETKNRFKLVFQDFVQALAQPDHPLVIFLDDCQWADLSTLKLLEAILLHPESNYFMVIAAYRENEIGNKKHPLLQTLNNLQAGKLPITTINLAPLTLTHIECFIADTLHQDTNQVKQIAKICYEKTKGNSFFMNQLLQALYKEGLLEFNIKKGKWLWDIGQINKKEISSNVVELLIKNINELSPAAQNILKIAACLGNRFDMQALVSITKNPYKQVMAALWEAKKKSLIISISDTQQSITHTSKDNNLYYQFLHDRIQQAAYSLTDEKERSHIHLDIGRIFMQKNMHESVLEIADQINRGINLITDDYEKIRVAELNLMAGIKVKNSIAYHNSLFYLKSGIALLNKNCWSEKYDLSLALYTEAAEAAFLCGSIEEMGKFIDTVVQYAKNVLDKLRVYEIKMIYLAGKYKYQEALDIGLNALKLLGVKLPRRPSKFKVIMELIYTKFILKGKTMDDLYNLPEMQNPQYKAAMIMLVRSGIAFYTDPNLFLLTNLKGISLSLKYGNSDRSALNYGGYGLILGLVFNQIERGYQFSQLALRLLDRYPCNITKIIVLLTNCMLSLWHDDIDKTLALFADTFQSGREIGDIEGTQISAYLYSALILYSGKNLNTVYKEIEYYMNMSIAISKEINIFNFSQEYIAISLQMAKNILGMTNDVTILSGDIFNEKRVLPKFINKKDTFGLFIFYQGEIFLNYLFHKYDEAVQWGRHAENCKLQIGFIHALAYMNFYSLSCLAIYKKSTKREQKKLLKIVYANQKKLKLWSQHEPTKFLHKYYLVEAELAHVLNKTEMAIDYFNLAIKFANENKFLHEEAVANELAAQFYLEKHGEKIAKIYMSDAYYCYLKWGAIAKVRHLEKCYPNLLTGVPYKISNEALAEEPKTVSQMLDLASVMKSAQAISSEIEFSNLLQKMMHIVIETAGAQKGFLIFEKSGKWCIEAEANINKNEIALFQSKPIDDVLPTALIQEVIQNKIPLAFDDAFKAQRFSSDSYIQHVKPKSVLCMPLMNQGIVSCVLYLENNLVSGAFTKKRIELLNLLSGQIVTSIDNTKLYSNLKALNQANESFVPKEFLSLLEKKSVMDLKLGDQIQKEMTVMFCDIRGFTSMSEKMTPKQTLAFLNEYLSKMEPVITKHNGVIDKYIGDAIMALFPINADDALRGSIAILKTLHEYNVERHTIDPHLPDIHVGIGLNTGLLVLGTVGDATRMEGTVISDAVNIASEVEELTKTYSGNILITKETYDKLKQQESYAIRKIGTVFIKQKSTPVTVYEVFDNDPSVVVMLKKATQNQFEKAIDLFDSRKYKKALTIFQQIVQNNPNDLAAIAYVKFCSNKILSKGKGQLYQE